MSRSKVITVALPEADRAWLTKLVSSGTHPRQMTARADQPRQFRTIDIRQPNGEHLRSRHRQPSSQQGKKC